MQLVRSLYVGDQWVGQRQDVYRGTKDFSRKSMTARQGVNDVRMFND